MPVTLGFADAGDKSGPHSVLIIGRDTRDLQTTGAPKAFSRRVTESCADGTIIVIIMNLCNCLSCIRILGNSCFCGNLDISQQVKRK
jgi:hypothetical protein